MYAIITKTKPLIFLSLYLRCSNYKVFVNSVQLLITLNLLIRNEQLDESALTQWSRYFRLTSIGVGVAITGLLGRSSRRSSGSGTFAVIVVVVEDTSGRLGWGRRDVGRGRGSGSGGGGGR
jgi:hypothetical protein